MHAYKDLQSSWIDEYRHHKLNYNLPQGFVLNMLTSLRHHCGTLKVKAAVEWVSEYNRNTGKPIVVFTHHKDVLQSIIDTLPSTLKIRVLAGGVLPYKRQDIIESFQRNEIDVLVCNTLATNMGITLTAADTVVFVEREWTPAMEEQAEDRVNRIGQDANKVHAVYLRVSNTIDERFARLVAQKREVIQGILDGGKAEDRPKLARELLMQMIQDNEFDSGMMGDF